MNRLPLWVWLGLMVGLSLGLVGGDPAAAHSEFQSADPPPGAQVATSPPQLRLVFSEPLSTTSQVYLHGENFQPVAGVHSQVDKANPHQLIVTTPPLPVGVYTVQWLAVGQDRHALRGSYQIAVSGQALPNPAFRWGMVAVVGVALLAAAIAFWRVQRSRLSDFTARP
jgi:copper resistance protein C